ncbi:intradiol ring-cleavage dioxygenase [Novosphingobium sp. LASN5T]|uniref:intradiol ring-cleavage dioxygenase n=1 Tax=Novosphingobium sp. LASN5T TaxID=2491021 RepID=UPI000F5FD58C|nr:intradiol ring-cleavage dioxygenase [Novosphingobium sp. LASN5T]RQW45044.1 6-chlorohydroxyquinol-1,2-dioxygenase [Novosphingobium sp. LASN5T]
MSYFTEAQSAEAVNARLGADIDPRLDRIMRSLVTHLHAFIKDVELTGEEWAKAIDFLTATGRICSAERQEFILLSDVLGASMLVDAINNRRPDKATQNTVLGPFHVAGAPVREIGESICLDGEGEACLFEGMVTDIAGRPVAGAEIDVWSDNADGFYDVQQPGVQPQWNNRGRFITDRDGRYAFIGIKPVSYPIPHDGPVGQMLDATGRHPWRPAHTHFIVSAPGFDRLVTHTFVAGDAWLESDAVFGVKAPLIVDYEPTPDAATPWRCAFDFVLAPADA